MYQALYRKYRPRRFSDVAGQEHITETLCGQIMTDRLTHAYLFVGTRGTGKTTCAKILSRAVNCLNPIDGNPCNECSSCTGIEEGTILDVLELDAASHNGVDDVRALRDEAIYTPATVKKRVYIIDEVHMLSKPAFNALLKILEEPPAHILFILATTELHKVLPTIQSRCQKFMFKRLSAEEISKRLQQIAASEGLTMSAEAAERLAILADGSMRDGISLLDQCVTSQTIDLEYVQSTLGLAAEYELIEMLRAIADYKVAEALGILDRLYKDGKDMTALLDELSGILRDLLVVKLTPNSADAVSHGGTTLISSSLSKAELTAASSLFTPERLFYCLETAKNSLYNLSHTGVPRLVLEMSLIRMCNERISDDHAAPAAPVVVSPGKPVGTTAPTPKPDTDTAHEIEPGPEPEPENSPTPEPAPAPTGDIMENILGNIADQSLKVMLNDSSSVQAAKNDNLVIITMSDSYDADTVKNNFLTTLTEAVKQTFTNETEVRIETGGR